MPLFLQPILKTKLWGGQRLSEFGYQLDNDTTGECWCVSAHPNGTSEIINWTISRSNIRPYLVRTS
ncbi:hypothetical protein JARBOU1357_21490 [Staphylococcus aureus]|nr:hypothetical protein JARBOU1357_21490 [Staphylococcus aureus]